jgi:hypothetical protein
MVLVLLVLYTLGSSFVRDYDYLPTDLPSLASLTPADRNAMRWMARATPPDSRVLVVSGTPWPSDRWSEWFPVIAGRRSVATVQGTEWLPGHAFARRERASAALVRCARRDVTCLTRWSDSTGIAFTHVFVSRAAQAPGESVERCCDRLLAALEADAMWVRVFDGPGAAIFERRALAAARNAQPLSTGALSSATASASARWAGVSR